MTTAKALSTSGRVALALALSLGLVACKGGLFGGSITAISFAIPGEAAASAIVADGYTLTRQGQGGKALKTSLYSATLADTTSNIVLIAAAIPLGSLAPLLGPSELTALLFAALTLIIIFSDDAPKCIISAGIGFVIGFVGISRLRRTGPWSGSARRFRQP